MILRSCLRSVSWIYLFPLRSLKLVEKLHTLNIPADWQAAEMIVFKFCVTRTFNLSRGVYFHYFPTMKQNVDSSLSIFIKRYWQYGESKSDQPSESRELVFLICKTFYRAKRMTSTITCVDFSISEHKTH